MCGPHIFRLLKFWKSAAICSQEEPSQVEGRGHGRDAPLVSWAPGQVDGPPPARRGLLSGAPVSFGTDAVRPLGFHVLSPERS